MPRSFALTLMLVAGLVISLVAALPLSGSVPQAGGPAPKTIILGFDGMDHALTTQFMAEGLMPNFQRLAKQGLFQRLETSNPAQSPVSWAVFNTGCNPGKTGVAGFVSRNFSRGKDKDGAPSWIGPPSAGAVPNPQPMLGFTDKRVPVADYLTFPMAVEQPTLFLTLAALLPLVVVLLLTRALFKLSLVLGAVLGLAAGAGGFFAAKSYVATLPADGLLPYVVNPMQGTSFWHYLDQQGIRMRGIQVASTYPPDDEGPNTQLLSGLGVPDIGGSPGTWFVYTTDKWLYIQEKGTGTGGKIFKLWEDEPNVLQAKLVGPRNWVQTAHFETALREIDQRLLAPGLPASEGEALKQQRDVVLQEQRQFRTGGNDRSSLPFTMRLDKAAHSVEFVIGSQTLRVAQGAWSDFIEVEFPLNERYSAKGLVNFHVVRCDDEEVRIFVPPINIDPRHAPPQLPISAPPEFAGQLQAEIGHAYETLGWACLTNPIKDIDDSKLPQQSFLDDIVFTEALREDLLMASLERPQDWDVYFQIFSTPDRTCHMLFRETDPQHPLHDSELAATQVSAWGRSFPLKDAVRENYREEDRLLGRVLDKLDAGDFGADCLLLIVSDHGFSSFRRQVNLNNWLAENGYLVFKEGMDLSAVLASGRTSEYLNFADWSKTRAYSLGLGEVFINLKGREPLGIVQPSGELALGAQDEQDYDALIEEIRRGLLALTDPVDGAKVVTTVSRRDELYSGPWWKEGRAARKVRGEPVPVDHDGFADLFLGYAPYYRVAWSNTAGGLDSATITDNDNHWSGDHVSVDPSHVPGILLSNRPLPPGTAAHLMDIAPTLLRRYGLDPAPPHTEMDGRALPFAGSTP
ncbi:MAG: alkaline phosphatase family protein [Planctomycetota bacterium]